MDPYVAAPFDPEDPELPGMLDELSLWAARFGELLLDELPLPREGRVLDLGCGAGFPLVELGQMLGPRTPCTGVDVWTAGLARADRKIRFHGLPAVHVVRADGAALPFPGGTFALVVSNLGVNNFADPAAAIREAARVLAPGGTFALTTNPRGHMAEVYQALRASLHAHGREDRLASLEAQEAHRPTRAWLEGALRDAGLAPVRAVESPLTLRYASGAAFLRHGLTRYGFLGGWRSALGEELAPAILADLEARLDLAARGPGELRLTAPRLYLEARRPRT